MAADGAIDEEALSVSELDRVYAPLRQQVSDSIHKQETILARIQVIILLERYVHVNLTMKYGMSLIMIVTLSSFNTIIIYPRLVFFFMFLDQDR